MSGGLAKLFTTPLSNITTRAQTARGQTSIRSIADSILREKGLMGFWSGYSASVVLTLNPSLTFFFYEALKGLLPKSRREDPGARLTFLTAALSKAMASSITYPFSLAKARAQASSTLPVQRTAAQIKEDAKTESSSASHTVSGARSAARREGHKAADATVLSSILRIAQEEGIGALYVGLGGEVLKGFFGHGITMIVKEQVHGWVIRLYFYLSESYRKANPVGQARDAAENVKGQATDAYERLSGQAQSHAGNLTTQAQSASHTLSEKASDAVEGVKQTATDAYQKAADTTSNITNRDTLSPLKGVVEPTHGAMAITPRSHTSGSAQPAPGAKTHPIYDGAVGTGTSVQKGGEIKSIAAGRTHSVYDQAIRETRKQDTIIDSQDMAEPVGQRTFPKGSEANLKIDKEGARGEVGQPTGAAGVAYMRDTTTGESPKLTGHGDVGNIPKMDELRKKKGSGN